MNKKIVVIGAGASGVAATTKLLGAGFRNIVLLEAEDRIGGRIHTIPFGKNVLDMGAQWWVASISCSNFCNYIVSNKFHIFKRFLF